MNRYTVTRNDLGDAVPEDEPCFVIRAKDIFAVPVVRKYLSMVDEFNLPYSMYDAVSEHLDRIMSYQSQNPDLVKIPD